MNVVINRLAMDAMLHHKNGYVNAEVTRIAIDVETEAKRLAPVDTGNLRASINHVSGYGDQGPVAYVGTDVPYAIYQELGTWKMRAQPFLRPALQSIRNRL